MEKQRNIGHTATEKDWINAFKKFQIIQPYLDEEVQLTKISKCAGVPIRTLKLWVHKYRKGGISELISKKVGKKGSGVSDELKSTIEGLALRTPPLSVASIHRYLESKKSEINEPIPGYYTIYRIVKAIDDALMTLAHEGKQAYQNKYDLVHRSEAECSNAIWQADHCVLDVLVKDKDILKKPWLTIILDDYSRAVAGYALYFAAPSSTQTALALRHAIWHKMNRDWEICGIPDILYTDHGSDFTSRHMEELSVNLKTRLIFSAVGVPRGRGKIERFFRSLQQVLLPNLPGYQPPGTISKTKKCMSLSQLAEKIEDYIVNNYHVTPHSATGANPKDKWRSNNFLPRMPESSSELDLLLLSVSKSRKVHNDGIKFFGFRYISSTLAGFVGEDVIVRYDPRDIAEISIFYDNFFLCKAICAELSGHTVSLNEIITARRRERLLQQTRLQDRAKSVDILLKLRNDFEADDDPADNIKRTSSVKQRSKLKRYTNEEW